MEIFTTMATYIGFLLGFLVRFLCYFRKASGKSLPILRKLRKPQTQTSRYINEDIWIEIFLKLPVKSVSRIRCVSKSWLSLTTSPNFIKAHFNLSPDRIISAPDSISIPNYIVSALHNADVDPDMWEKFRYCGAFGSDTDLFTYSHVVGICNGLICIHRHPCDIILWNPTTGRFRILPPSGTECFKECDHYGFGYNRLNDDYKVVEITTVLKVYSSLENTWRIILDCASLNADVIFDGPLGIFANGALHWVVHYQDEPNIRAIFALDMATEVCNFIGVGTPCNKYEYGGNAIKNVVLGASLDRLWISYNFKDYLEIWILSEKPVSGWSKFLCVKAQSWVYDPMTTKPLHILEDGCAFIMYDSNPLFKNLGGLRIYKPPEFDMDHFYSYLISTEAFIYRESLAIP